MMLYYQCEQRSFGRCSIYLGTILFLLLIQFVLGLVFIANLLYIYQKRRQTGELYIVHATAVRTVTVRVKHTSKYLI